MGRLAVGILLMGLFLSFHETLWAGMAVLAWAGAVAIEIKYNKKLWE